MSLEQVDPFEELSNPLDCVEDLLSAQNWVFDRASEDELKVQITGRSGAIYDMRFIWQEDYSAMQFTCELDMNIPARHMDEAAQTMTAINSNLWLGHFDFVPGTQSPRFRHTSLFRGMNGTSGADHIEDLVDIALAECERFGAAFLLLANPDRKDAGEMALAMMDTSGEA